MRKTAFLFSIPAAIGLLVLLVLVRSAQAAEPTGRSQIESACSPCHAQGNLNLNLPSGETLPLKVDPLVIASSVHSALQCTDCHRALSNFPHPPAQATSLLEYRLSQQAVCQTCHINQSADIQASVHSQAAAADRPTCTGCHGAHEVQSTGAASFRLGSVNSCSTCHANPNIMGKYSVSTDVTKTYLQDFHGKTVALLGEQGQNMKIDEAVCTDCHSAHNIKSVAGLDPNVMKANLAGICGKCHQGATQNFPAAWLSHYEPSLDKAPLVFLARLFYWVMIPFTIVGLLIHILLDVRKRSLARRRPR